MTTVDKNMSSQFALLRALVGFLGEKRQCNWWDTDFLSPTGLQFLAINFPRSAFAAGCNSVSEAAKRLHDQRIGKGGVFHLFRFPESIEERVHQAIMAMDSKVMIPHLKGTESALSKLKSLAATTVKAPEGPVLVGTTKEILQDSVLDRIAQLYFTAFSKDFLCFPYFSSLLHGG